MRRAGQGFTGFAAIIVSGLSLPPALAEDASFEAAQGLPPSIHIVQAGGYWSQGSQESFFRAVVTAGGPEHVVHRLYVRWLRTNAETLGYQPLRTVNVTELNLGHGFVLEIKTALDSINAFDIDVLANSRGGKTRRFAITATGVGK